MKYLNQIELFVGLIYILLSNNGMELLAWFQILVGCPKGQQGMMRDDSNCQDEIVPPSSQHSDQHILGRPPISSIGGMVACLIQDVPIPHI